MRKIPLADNIGKSEFLIACQMHRIQDALKEVMLEHDLAPEELFFRAILQLMDTGEELEIDRNISWPSFLRDVANCVEDMETAEIAEAELDRIVRDFSNKRRKREGI